MQAKYLAKNPDAPSFLFSNMCWRANESSVFLVWVTILYKEPASVFSTIDGWMLEGDRKKTFKKKTWHVRWVFLGGTGIWLVGSIKFVCRFICCLQDLGHFWGKGRVEGSFYHLLVFSRSLSQFSKSLGAFTEQEFKLWGLICLSSDPLSSNQGKNGHSCPNPFPSGPIWR